VKYLSLSLAIIAVCGSSAPVNAQNASKVRTQNSMVNTNTLEPVEFYHAQRRLQIVPEGPIITNSVRPERTAPKYIFVGSGDPNAGTGSGINLSSDGQIPPGGIPIQGGPQTISHSIPGVGPLNDLPASGFTTNIPSGGTPMRNNLPSGRSTNGLMGHMAGTLPPAPPIFQAPPSIRPTPASQPSPPNVATYKPINGNGSGSTQQRTVTEVSAKMIRQHLLDRGK
jgi:hypothetical protein